MKPLRKSWPKNKSSGFGVQQSNAGDDREYLLAVKQEKELLGEPNQYDSSPVYDNNDDVEFWKRRCQDLEHAIEDLQEKRHVMEHIQQAQETKRDSEDREIIAAMKIMKLYIERLEEDNAALMAYKRDHPESPRENDESSSFDSTTGKRPKDAVHWDIVSTMARKIGELKKEITTLSESLTSTTDERNALAKENTNLLARVDELTYENEMLHTKCQSLEEATSTLVEELEKATPQGRAPNDDDTDSLKSEKTSPSELGRESAEEIDCSSNDQAKEQEIEIVVDAQPHINNVRTVESLGDVAVKEEEETCMFPSIGKSTKSQVPENADSLDGDESESVLDEAWNELQSDEKDDTTGQVIIKLPQHIDRSIDTGVARCNKDYSIQVDTVDDRSDDDYSELSVSSSHPPSRKFNEQQKESRRGDFGGSSNRGEGESRRGDTKESRQGEGEPHRGGFVSKQLPQHEARASAMAWEDDSERHSHHQTVVVMAHDKIWNSASDTFSDEERDELGPLPSNPFASVRDGSVASGLSDMEQYEKEVAEWRRKNEEAYKATLKAVQEFESQQKKKKQRNSVESAKSSQSRLKVIDSMNKQASWRDKLFRRLTRNDKHKSKSTSKGSKASKKTNPGETDSIASF